LFLTIVEFLRQGEYFDKLEVLTFEESANFRCYFFTRRRSTQIWDIYEPWMTLWRSLYALIHQMDVAFDNLYIVHSSSNFEWPEISVYARQGISFWHVFGQIWPIACLTLAVLCDNVIPSVFRRHLVAIWYLHWLTTFPFPIYDIIRDKLFNIIWKWRALPVSPSSFFQTKPRLQCAWDSLKNDRMRLMTVLGCTGRAVSVRNAIWSCEYLFFLMKNFGTRIIR